MNITQLALSQYIIQVSTESAHNNLPLITINKTAVYKHNKHNESKVVQEFCEPLSVCSGTKLMVTKQRSIPSLCGLVFDKIALNP